MLLRRSEPPGPPRLLIAPRLVEHHPRDPEINEVCTVLGEHHVARGDIRVNHPVRMELSDSPAHIRDNRRDLCKREVAAPFHEPLECVARNIIVYRHELIGQLVHGMHARQIRAVAFGKRCPHHAAYACERNAFAHERAGSVERHELRHTIDPVCELALDHVGVVDVHTMQRLLFLTVHSEPSSGFTSVRSPKR